jgi:ABC-2 type transport system ATP-binding protein
MIVTGRGPVVEADGVSKRYGDRVVLRDVSFAVARGEVFGLLGPNGAGKTTTLEILEGFRPATAGRVRILGFDPATHDVELRQRTGVVLQECGFPLHLRVGELLDAWRSFYRSPRPLGELLDVVELAPERNRVVRRLSGGQRRRLDFALALAGDPEVVFLDEPTTGFDPEARRRCWDAIGNLRALGTTIVLTTHYLDEAQHLADRVAVLCDGTIRACGTPAQLARQVGAEPRLSLVQPTLEEVYLQLVGTAEGMS